MGKFYKPGKVVVVLNGRYAGHKGIIVRSNYESIKDRKYPHCLVVGLSKGPRKATKRNLAKIKEQIRKFDSKNDADKVASLKSFGVFIKTYNMSHLLATRYTVKEDFGAAKAIDKLDNLEKKVKEDRAIIKLKEKSNDEKVKKEVETLKQKVGNEFDNYKEELRNVKAKIGGEMYKRFNQGFTKSTKEEDKENQQNTQFLFKKLHF